MIFVFGIFLGLLADRRVVLHTQMVTDGRGKTHENTKMLLITYEQHVIACGDLMPPLWFHYFCGFCFAMLSTVSHDLYINSGENLVCVLLDVIWGPRIVNLNQARDFCILS